MKLVSALRLSNNKSSLARKKVNFNVENGHNTEQPAMPEIKMDLVSSNRPIPEDDNYLDTGPIDFEKDMMTPREIVRSTCTSYSSNPPSSYRNISRLSESGKRVIVDIVRLFGEENVNLSLEEAFEDSEIMNDSEGTYIYLNCIKHFSKKVAMYRKREETSFSSN